MLPWLHLSAVCPQPCPPRPPCAPGLINQLHSTPGLAVASLACLFGHSAPPTLTWPRWPSSSRVCLSLVQGLVCHHLSQASSSSPCHGLIGHGPTPALSWSCLTRYPPGAVIHGSPLALSCSCCGLIGPPHRRSADGLVVAALPAAAPGLVEVLLDLPIGPGAGDSQCGKEEGQGMDISYYGEESCHGIEGGTNADNKRARLLLASRPGRASVGAVAWPGSCWRHGPAGLLLMSWPNKADAGVEARPGSCCSRGPSQIPLTSWPVWAPAGIAAQPSSCLRRGLLGSCCRHCPAWLLLR
jgi:hypothetical protein